MSRLRFFIGKYNLLKLRIDLKAVVYIPICCLNPHFFFLFLFMLELCCRIFSARDVFLGHGSFSWITQSSMFNFHSLLYQLNFVSISNSCVFFFFFFFALLLRENKNIYVLAFLKSLVDCGLFEHIYLNFLPVGHTHCDIDQLFSRIAVWMRGRKPCKKFLESNSPKLTLHFMFMLTFCSTPSVHMG